MYLAFSMIKIFFAVLTRVGEVLDMEEVESEGFNDSMTNLPDDTRIRIGNASFTWGFSVRKDKNVEQGKEEIDENSNDKNLESIDFKAKSKDLIAVVGEVGSGKSTFLSAIMKELKLVEGSVSV